MSFAFERISLIFKYLTVALFMTAKKNNWKQDQQRKDKLWFI